MRYCWLIAALVLPLTVWSEDKTVVAAPAFSWFEGALPKAVVPSAQQPSRASARAADGAGAESPPKAALNDLQAAADTTPQVRLVAVETDAAKRYGAVVPDLPIPPFSGWRRWIKAHEKAVHCALEWRDTSGQWWHGELRSLLQFEGDGEQYCVGRGEFPGTAFDAYGVYIFPGRLPRDVNERGQPIVVVLDEKIEADYREVDAQIRKYAAKDARPGEPGTGGEGKENVGLGGPAYKPGQNSNTMVNYVLRRCGVERAAPALAVGWDTQPHFPRSTNAESASYDNQP